MKHSRMITHLTVAALALAGISCSEQAGNQPLEPAFNHASTPIERHVILCKEGSSATFDITNGDVPDIALADGDCEAVASHPGTPTSVFVTINETGTPPGFALDYVLIEELGVGGGLISSTTESGPEVTVELHDDVAVRVTYHNISIASANGRMTGGNNLRVGGAIRITGGLEIHCDITLSNNLEVNWAGGNKWHLDKPITSAICIDDPAVDPVPPDAPFDTFIGDAIGRLNGVDGSYIRFTFVDDGEPGTSDHATIDIWAPGDDPATDPPVLSISDFLTHGNIQAHWDQPHK